MKNLVEELRWRGLLQDIIPGTEEQLQKEMTTGYIGFDPTADSLHIGNLVPVMLLTHLQNAGHKPLVLVGGATGLVGDPSGKSAERKMLSPEEIEHNLNSQKKQLENFLNFDKSQKNCAEVVNNYDWFSEINFLEFIRDVGRHISINYMMAKDSVQNRLETGMSFTEFSYQLVQGYDFYWLYTNKNCRLQMGGSDQWGNITTGTELIRRKGSGDAFALTAPLLKKADGSKFGKSEGGNIWIDRARTSPYKFYQYWINSTDEDAARYIRIFTLFEIEEIEALEKKHAEDPSQRTLQKALAKDITIRVHSEDDYEIAVAATQILFGKSTEDDLRKIGEEDFLSIFEGVDQAVVSTGKIEEGLEIIEALSEESGFLKSKGEARRALKENSISVNKTKVQENKQLTKEDLLNGKYILLQRGKKKYFILRIE